MAEAPRLTIAVFGVLGGVLAALARAAGLRDLRRIRRAGVPTPALVITAGPGPEGGERPLLPYTTGDGRVIEVFLARPPRPGVTRYLMAARGTAAP